MVWSSGTSATSTTTSSDGASSHQASLVCRRTRSLRTRGSATATGRACARASTLMNAPPPQRAQDRVLRRWGPCGSADQSLNLVLHLAQDRPCILAVFDVVDALEEDRGHLVVVFAG